LDEKYIKIPMFLQGPDMTNGRESKVSAGGRVENRARLDYIYASPGRFNPQSFDLSSVGPDGRVGGGDDICNWKQN